jgi:small subunit ribosomal protein S19
MARAKKGRTSPKAARRRERKRRGLIQVRAKKEFSFRGFKLDELQAMSIEELLPLLPSRSRRSILRGFLDDQEKLMQKIAAGRDNVRTHRRDTVVLPNMVGKTIGVYNGKAFIDVTIQPEMIGHFLGEFALTRKRVNHTGPGVGATRSSKYMPLK